MSIEVGFIPDGGDKRIIECVAELYEMPIVIDNSDESRTLVIADERRDEIGGFNVYVISDPDALELPVNSSDLLYYVTNTTLAHTILPGGYYDQYVRTTSGSCAWMILKHIIDPGTVADHTAN